MGPTREPPAEGQGALAHLTPTHAAGPRSCLPEGGPWTRGVWLPQPRGPPHLRQVHLKPCAANRRQILCDPWLGEFHTGTEAQRTLLLFSSVQSLGRVRLSATAWTAARQASLSITNSRSSRKLVSMKSVMLPTTSSFLVPFSSHLQPFPASGSFQMRQFFASGGQSIGVSASASVIPMNTQD